ncbi:riboflavin synthase [Artemisia annua]|uniref:Riboflavin synthase n=1 Tax=Artemisia annua TaxID=35608 RepID=A0A2U1KGS2_ARTAN|nr:riboflavin synthase [Artemisia annua]
MAKGDFVNVGLTSETLRKTTLDELAKGDFVNVERAIKPSARMGGHFVQGHVDGTGEIVKTCKEILRFIVPKGFITVDGTSLTVCDVFDDEDCYDFMLVEYTQQKVMVARKEVGMKVNLEDDVLGKYVERLLSSGFVESIKSRAL